MQGYRLYSRLPHKPGRRLQRCDQFSSPKYHCSIPLCSANQQLQPYLSFHHFPTDTQLRAHWVYVIRRDEGVKFKMIPNSTYVCSLYFTLMTFTSMGFITVSWQTHCQ
ncbi:hypothetical protein NL108_000579 [Boleophthalmus pectinirostris]|nr:hypothetical protein NL108_000579 [Boleophthalmus pectinirostris]